MKASSPYPDDFLWGASTGSYQVEGGNVNQWSEWEKQNAEELARTAKDRLGWLPAWHEIEKQASDPANYLSGNGVEHYTRYADDFDVLQELGMNAFRFGIEWSRVQPAENEWDEQAIQHYHRYIDELNRRGVEPVLTLWHWTSPLWFTEKGAFEKRTNLKYFDRYVERMAAEFGNKVRYVITLNEPNVYASFSYQLGEWTPQRHNPWQMITVYRHLAQAHRSAYGIFKKANPDVRVSIAHQLGDSRPKNPRNIVNRLVVLAISYAWNWWFTDHVRNQLDFIGINYYFTEYRDWCGRLRNPSEPVSDLGWYMEPSGLQNVLEDAWRRYRKPLLVTENGLADVKDVKRQWWLEQTMVALEGAVKNGVRVIGYMHWSLLDNFEWKFGWWPKFGLVSVDRERDMRRTVRRSARWLATYISKNS